MLPGFNFNPDTTGYLRLGYDTAKGTLSSSGTVNGTNIASSSSKKFKGSVVGIGMDQAFAPNLAARIEYQVHNFSSITESNVTYKPRSNGFDASIRYAF